jgi:hypothetical protein
LLEDLVAVTCWCIDVLVDKRRKNVRECVDGCWGRKDGEEQRGGGRYIRREVSETEIPIV